MKFGSIPAVAALVLLATTAVQAQTAPSDDAPLHKPLKEKHVCRSEEVTGSVVTRRICHTRAEWIAIDNEQQNSADAAARQRDSHWGSGGLDHH